MSSSIYAFSCPSNMPQYSSQASTPLSPPAHIEPHCRTLTASQASSPSSQSYTPLGYASPFIHGDQVFETSPQSTTTSAPIPSATSPSSELKVECTNRAQAAFILRFNRLLEDLPLIDNQITQILDDCYAIRPRSIPTKPCKMYFLDKLHVVLPVIKNNTILTTVIVRVTKSCFETLNSCAYDKIENRLSVYNTKEEFLGGEANFIANFFDLANRKTISVLRSDGELDSVNLARHEKIKKFITCMDQGKAARTSFHDKTPKPSSSTANPKASELAAIPELKIPASMVAALQAQQQTRYLSDNVSEKDEIIKQLSEENRYLIIQNDHLYRQNVILSKANNDMDKQIRDLRMIINDLNNRLKASKKLLHAKS